MPKFFTFYTGRLYDITPHSGVKKMTQIPLIGIMVPRKKSRKPVLKVYQRYLDEHRFIHLCAFTPSSVSFEKGTVTGIIKSAGDWIETELPVPSAVYNRCYNKSAFRKLEKLVGHRFFNSVTFLNKWTVYSIFRETRLKKYLPESFLLDLNALPEFLAKHGLAFIKPLHGNRGYGVFRLEKKDGGNVFISTHSLPPLDICRKDDDLAGKMGKYIKGEKYLMQQGISSRQAGQNLFDLRVLVQKDIGGNWGVSAFACRVAYEDYFNTGIFKGIYEGGAFLGQLYGKKSGKLVKKINNLAVAAATVLDDHIGMMGELSVDFVLDQNKKPWLIEVNGKPDKGIYRQIEGFKDSKLVFLKPLYYACYLAQCYLPAK